MFDQIHLLVLPDVPSCVVRPREKPIRLDSLIYRAGANLIIYRLVKFEHTSRIFRLMIQFDQIALFDAHININSLIDSYSML
jgi:hypothetical protein